MRRLRLELAELWHVTGSRFRGRKNEGRASTASPTFGALRLYRLEHDRRHLESGLWIHHKKKQRWECSRSDALPFILAQEWDSDARVGLYSFSTATKLELSATLNIVRSRAWSGHSAHTYRLFRSPYPPHSIVVLTTNLRKVDCASVDWLVRTHPLLKARIHRNTWHKERPTRTWPIIEFIVNRFQSKDLIVLWKWKLEEKSRSLWLQISRMCGPSSGDKILVLFILSASPTWARGKIEECICRYYLGPETQTLPALA